MQLVLPFEHMAKAAQYMEPSVFNMSARVR